MNETWKGNAQAADVTNTLVALRVSTLEEMKVHCRTLDAAEPPMLGYKIQVIE